MFERKKAGVAGAVSDGEGSASECQGVSRGSSRALCRPRGGPCIVSSMGQEAIGMLTAKWFNLICVKNYHSEFSAYKEL